MKKLLLLFIPIAVFCSCNNGPVAEEVAVAVAGKSDLQQLEWLLGSWENLSAEGNSYERWKKISDTQYGGIGFVLSGSDTVFYEQLLLEQRKDGLYYIPVVRNQNNAEPVPFKLSSATNETFIFENLQHDFPQQILYRRVTPDSLYAEISGTENGKKHVEKFPMHRSK